MILVVCKVLVPNGFAGITVFPFIILRNQKLKKDAFLVNHERIHLRQQLEMAIIFFFIWYFVEFVIRYIILKDKEKAYKSISFEKESYANETNLNYLDKRRCFKFLNYL